jgi:hypothetical protein
MMLVNNQERKGHYCGERVSIHPTYRLGVDNTAKAVWMDYTKSNVAPKKRHTPKKTKS